MKYRDIMGFSKKKKKIIKEQSKSKKKTILDGIKQELNEWSYQPPSAKRWSKPFDGDSGLTENEKNDKEKDDKDIILGKKIQEISSSQANVLLKQLGGNKFKAMVGAKDFGIGSDGLHFKIGRNSKSISHVVIDLDRGKDLYDIKFLRVRAGKIKVVKKLKGIYADQLGDVFKRYTGMNVRL